MDPITELRQQLRATRQEVAYLRGVLTQAGLIALGWEEVKEAVRQGDFEPYKRWKAAGGVIPKTETTEGEKRRIGQRY